MIKITFHSLKHEKPWEIQHYNPNLFYFPAIKSLSFFSFPVSMSVLFSFSTVVSVVSAFQSKSLIDEGILVATAAIVESWQTNSRRSADATRKRDRERKTGRSEKQRNRQRGRGASKMTAALSSF